MCNLSEGVYERGMEAGRQAGMKAGAEKQAVEMILSMLTLKMNYSDIAKISKMSVDRIKAIALENHLL